MGEQEVVKQEEVKIGEIDSDLEAFAYVIQGAKYIWQNHKKAVLISAAVLITVIVIVFENLDKFKSLFGLIGG